MKHQRQLEELRATSEATIKELEQLQNEKRKMLVEHETAKLKEQEEEYNKELKEWKSQLKPRKQVSFYLFIGSSLNRCDSEQISTKTQYFSLVVDTSKVIFAFLKKIWF